VRVAIWFSTSCKDEKPVNTRQLNRPGGEMYPGGETEIAGRKTETGRRKPAWNLTSLPSPKRAQTHKASRPDGTSGYRTANSCRDSFRGLQLHSIPHWKWRKNF